MPRGRRSGYAVAMTRMIPRALAALLGLVLAGPFALRWLLSPEATKFPLHGAISFERRESTEVFSVLSRFS